MSPSGHREERRNTSRGGRSSESPGAPQRADGEESPERGGRGRGTFPLSRGLLLPIVGLLVLVLVVGGLLLWRWYGDQVGGTNLFEDSVASGPEPLVRLTNGAGQVRVEGVEAEVVEISAKRYARGSDPTAARENAAGVSVDVAREGSTLEIRSDGGRGTGVDYSLRVPVGSKVEVESAAGGVEVSGVADSVQAKAEMGDVTVRDARGSVTVEAPRGDVEVSGVSTETGNVELSVGSGDLVLRDLLVGVLEARVEAGSAELLGRFAGSGRLLVETGSIAVRVPPEDVRELSLEARVGEVSREGEDAEGNE